MNGSSLSEGSSQGKSARPWPPGWNRLLGDPEKLGAGSVLIFLGSCFLLIGVLAVIRLLIGAEGTAAFWINIASAVFGLLGWLYIRGGLRLRRHVAEQR